MSQSGRYAESDVDDAGSLSLQGHDLDSLKDYVQSQIQQDLEADQAKGRKSPAANRGTIARRGSFNNHNTGTSAGNNAGNKTHAVSHSIREQDASDQHSDTTEVEKYMNSITGDSKGGDMSKTDAIMKLASQMDKSDIDKTIAVLLHLRTVVDDSPASGNQASPQVLKNVQQTQYAQRRSKSGPPGSGGSSSNLYAPPMSPPGPLATLRSCFSDSQTASNYVDSDNEGELEEVRHHNDYYEYAFIPPATQKPIQQLRSESEISYVTSNGGSRASTPSHSTHKRSPTPVTNPNSHAITQEVNQHCPVVERPPTTLNQKPNGFMETKVPHITVTEFSRPALSRDSSGVDIAKVQSPRHSRGGSVCDDLVSVGSSNSSFTAVTANSAGGYSYSKNR